jgi:glutaredoxin
MAELVSEAWREHSPVAVTSSFIRTVFFVVVFGLLALACRKKENATTDVGPMPVVTADDTDKLFTWIDDKGEFHVEPKVAAVPENARETVRVADPVKDPPKLDDIFVADLRAPGADGHYKVGTMSRTDFEKIAIDRRHAGGAKGLNPRGAASVLPSNAEPGVIIYGASWCGPCHQAADYLKSQNVAYVLKDIEEDRGAAREMRTKLEAAGMRGGSIPVIDVHGKILIGFDAGQINRALKM